MFSTKIKLNFKILHFFLRSRLLHCLSLTKISCMHYLHPFSDISQKSFFPSFFTWIWAIMGDIVEHTREKILVWQGQHTYQNESHWIVFKLETHVQPIMNAKINILGHTIVVAIVESTNFNKICQNGAIYFFILKIF